MAQNWEKNVREHDERIPSPLKRATRDSTVRKDKNVTVKELFPVPISAGAVVPRKRKPARGSKGQQIM